MAVYSRSIPFSIRMFLLFVIIVLAFGESALIEQEGLPNNVETAQDTELRTSEGEIPYVDESDTPQDLQRRPSEGDIPYMGEHKSETDIPHLDKRTSEADGGYQWNTGVHSSSEEKWHPPSSYSADSTNATNPLSINMKREVQRVLMGRPVGENKKFVSELNFSIGSVVSSEMHVNIADVSGNDILTIFPPNKAIESRISGPSSSSTSTSDQSTRNTEESTRNIDQSVSTTNQLARNNDQSTKTDESSRDIPTSEADGGSHRDTGVNSSLEKKWYPLPTYSIDVTNATNPFSIKLTGELKSVPMGGAVGENRKLFSELDFSMGSVVTTNEMQIRFLDGSGNEMITIVLPSKAIISRIINASSTSTSTPNQNTRNNDDSTRYNDQSTNTDENSRDIRTSEVDGSSQRDTGVNSSLEEKWHPLPSYSIDVTNATNPFSIKLTGELKSVPMGVAVGENRKPFSELDFSSGSVVTTNKIQIMFLDGSGNETISIVLPSKAIISRISHASSSSTSTSDQITKDNDKSSSTTNQSSSTINQSARTTNESTRNNDQSKKSDENSRGSYIDVRKSVKRSRKAPNKPHRLVKYLRKKWAK